MSTTPSPILATSSAPPRVSLSLPCARRFHLTPKGRILKQQISSAERENRFPYSQAGEFAIGRDGKGGAVGDEMPIDDLPLFWR
jgi:hypothetical protein